MGLCQLKTESVSADDPSLRSQNVLINLTLALCMYITQEIILFATFPHVVGKEITCRSDYLPLAVIKISAVTIKKWPFQCVFCEILIQGNTWERSWTNSMHKWTVKKVPHQGGQGACISQFTGLQHHSEWRGKVGKLEKNTSRVHAYTLHT